MKILHVASEAFPLIKTGGLADVAYALPAAQNKLKESVRLLLPGYPAVFEKLGKTTLVAELGNLYGAARIRIVKGKMPKAGFDVYVIDSPSLFNRSGNPYLGPDGKDWADNHKRFALLAWVAAHIAAGDIDRRWTPDVVHAHDWHAGLTPAFMAQIPGLKAKSVFTIHNLAFRGLFDYRDINELNLPRMIRESQHTEFYGQFSTLKTGIAFANKVTTVSPTYAHEILNESMGFGLHGVLQTRINDFEGILNGLDYTVWNPAKDQVIASVYDVKSLSKKELCKKDLCKVFKLPYDKTAPLFGVISRLAEQKGLDLVLEAIPSIVKHNAKLVLLGSGDSFLESRFKEAAKRYPDHVAVSIGYDEALSHKVVAGADSLLVPSRFEPCGLTQIMALRYGTLPLVRATGGLSDTVTQIDDNTGDGFRFGEATVSALIGTIDYTCRVFQNKSQWQASMKRAMEKDFSWKISAQRYLDLYRSLID